MHPHQFNIWKTTATQQMTMSNCCNNETRPVPVLNELEIRQSSRSHSIEPFPLPAIFPLSHQYHVPRPQASLKFQCTQREYTLKCFKTRMLRRKQFHRPHTQMRKSWQEVTGNKKGAQCLYETAVVDKTPSNLCIPAWERPLPNTGWRPSGFVGAPTYFRPAAPAPGQGK